MNRSRRPTHAFAFAMVRCSWRLTLHRCVAGKIHPARPSRLPGSEPRLFLAVRNHNERAVTEILQDWKLTYQADEEFQDRLDRERLFR